MFLFKAILILNNNFQIRKFKKTLIDQNLITRDSSQLPIKSDSVSTNNTAHLINTNSNTTTIANQMINSIGIEPGVFGSRRTPAFMTNFSVEDGTNMDIIDSIDNQINGLNNEFGNFNNNNEDTDSDQFDDDLIENDDVINQYSNLKLIMNSNALLSGEYGLCYKRCLRCNRRLEHYSDESIGGLIVACAAVVHRECTLAAPLIIEMLIACLK